MPTCGDLTTDEQREVQLCVSNLKKSIECPICCCSLVDPYSTPCNHQFCKTCILEHEYRSTKDEQEARRSKKAAAPARCPMCKQPFTRRALKQSPRFAALVESVTAVIEGIKEDTGGEIQSQRVAITNTTCAFPVENLSQMYPQPEKPHAEPQTVDDSLDADTPLATTTTTTTTAAEPATATAAATAAATPKPPMMPFNEYCKAKTVHNMASNIAGVPVAIGSILLNSWVFVMVFPEVYDGSVPQDQLPQFFGLDLMVIAGMTGMASAVLGFAGGKWLYSQAYALLAPARARQMDARHADFVDRITTRRHATTSMSDDYYGDKIKSLSDYRKWLRVQHKRGKEPANDALRDPFADFGKKKQ